MSVIDSRLGAALSRAHRLAIRRRLELEHGKWGAQVSDRTALSSAPSLLRRAACLELRELAEGLFAETGSATTAGCSSRRTATRAPVPLYNAVPFPNAFVALYEVLNAFSNGAAQLGAPPAAAPPAFLIDSLRMHRRPAS